MHDILEGILPLVLVKLILYCLRKKYFTLVQLNDLTTKFKYGHREIINKPCDISMSSLNAGKIDQSASQLWLLAINFPLIVGHHVPTHDEAWHCFTVLLELTRIIFLDSILDLRIVMLEQFNF
jgi:hypothetical protein